jgi:hypothetical protein
MGGYCCPFLSTLGSHVHHCSLGTSSMTLGTCWPQPNHDAFSVKELLGVWWGGIQGWDSWDILQVLHVALWHIIIAGALWSRLIQVKD